MTFSGRAGRGPAVIRGRPSFLPDEPGQQVFGADVSVVQPPGLFLGEDHGSPGLVSEPLEHGVTPLSGHPLSTQSAPAGLRTGAPGTRRS